MLERLQRRCLPSTNNGETEKAAIFAARCLTAKRAHDFSQSFGKIAYRRQSGARAQVFPPHRFPPVVMALFLIAGAFLFYSFSTADSRAEGSSANCVDTPELAVLPAPIAPWRLLVFKWVPTSELRGRNENESVISV
jgi:hypothetical protein